MNILPDLANLPLALRVEISENAFRKSLTQSELAAQQAIILEVLRRQNQPGRRTDLEPQSDTSAKVLAEVNGRPTEIVGRMFGESHAQIEKRLAIMRAAEAEPERFGKLVADMDRTGRVDGPFKRLRVARQAEAIRAEPPPYPGRGPYRVIVADPPWPYELRKKDPSHRATHPYPQMSIAEICAESEKVKALAHEDCILWLWTTNHHMREAFVVLDAWGFKHKTILTWAKDRFGTGDWLRGQTEHCYSRCAASRLYGFSTNRRSSQARCARTRRSRRNSMPSSKGSARHRVIASCSRAELARIGTATATNTWRRPRGERRSRARAARTRLARGFPRQRPRRLRRPSSRARARGIPERLPQLAAREAQRLLRRLQLWLHRPPTPPRRVPRISRADEDRTQ